MNKKSIAISLLSLLLSFAPATAQLLFEPAGDIHFENTVVGEQQRVWLTVIGNPRNDVQQQVNVNMQGDAFTSAPNFFVIEAGQRVAITLTFQPPRAGDFSATLTVTAGGPDGRAFTYEIHLSGQGVVPASPQIAYSPERFDFDVDRGHPTAQADLTISNVGEQDLTFEVPNPQVAWLTVSDPRRGTIHPGAHVTLVIRTTDDIQQSGEYDTPISISSNDPDSQLVHVPVYVTASLPEIRNQRIQLQSGWNTISLNVVPDEHFQENGHASIQLILQQILDQVTIIKDVEGRFCLPSRNFWGIPFWESSEGYQIRVSEATVLEVTGEAIPPNRQINLLAGWNLTAYYPNQQMRADSAFAELVGNGLLVIMKWGNGDFYLPDRNFGGSNPTLPGEGYQIKVVRDCSFSYPGN
jgi:hypothetical protein